MISFSSLSKRRGATLAGVFSLALSCALLLCGAGSAPIENLLPQGAMQGDLNAGGHSLTNAATVSATNVAVSGSLTVPTSFTLPFSRLTGTPTTLGGYGITDPVALTSGSYGNPSWIASLAASKLTGALPAVSGASLTGLAFSQIGGTLAIGQIPTGTSSSTAAIGNDSRFLTTSSQIQAVIGSGVYEPALGNPATNGFVLSSTTGGTRSWIAPGGSLTLGSNQGGALTLGGGALDFAVAPNTAGGLARLVASDGTADGSVAFLGTTDDGNDSMAIGPSSVSTANGIAIGYYANATGGGLAIGNSTGSSGGVALNNASTGTGAGIAIGGNLGASASSGVAIGNGVFATSGIAIGASAVELGGGVELGPGTYGGVGIAINADEIAVSNGSGYSTLSGRDDGTTPTNTTTQVGWVHVHVNGVDSWIPYYQ